MVCKESVNLTREQKKWEAAGAVPTECPVQFWGRVPGETRHNVPRRGGSATKDFLVSVSRTSPLCRSRLTPSFGNHRTDLDRISVQTAADRGSLAGLLVQRGQSRFIGGFQSINLVADDQGELGSMRDASASTLCRRLVFHMFSAAHRVPYFASKGTVAARQSIGIWKCRRCKYQRCDCREAPRAAIHTMLRCPLCSAARLVWTTTLQPVY